MSFIDSLWPMWLPDDICPGTKRKAPIGMSASRIGPSAAASAGQRPSPKPVSPAKNRLPPDGSVTTKLDHWARFRSVNQRLPQ